MKDHFQKKCWLHQNWYNFQKEFCWKCTHCTKNKNCLQPRLLTATLLLLQLWIRHNCSQLIFYCKTKMFVLCVMFWGIVQFFFLCPIFVCVQVTAVAFRKCRQWPWPSNFHGNGLPLICFSQPYNVIIMISIKINKNLAYIRCIFPHRQLLEAMDIRFGRGSSS